MSVFYKTLMIFLVSCFFGASISKAADIPVNEVGKKRIGDQKLLFGLVVDSNRTMGIEEVSKVKDVQITTPRFTIKSIDHNYWFVFKLKNTDSKQVEQIVGFDEVYMETADIYYLKDSSEWYYEKNGLWQPLNERSIENRCPVFKVVLKPGESKTIYLKLHSKFAIVLGLVIEDVPAFVLGEQARVIGYWGYFGAAIAFLAYNLVLLLYVRERLYLYYVIYAFCLIVFTFLYSGYALYVNSSVSLHYMLHASIALTGLFVSMFTRELLKTKQVNIWIDKTVQFIALVYLVLAVLIVVNVYYYQWLVFFGMPSMLFLVFVGIFCAHKKVPLAKYFVIGTTGYLIGLFMIAAVNLGVIPFNTITRYGFLIGSFVELSVFSLVLGYRVKLLQDEKTLFHNRLLASEKMQKNNLETEVKKRTQELEVANKELNIQVESNKRAYLALKESEGKLKQINDSKDKFFSIISHDLKSPFNSIIGFTDLLKREYDNLDSNTKQGIIHNIDRSVNHTYSLLENLLLWAMSQTDGIGFSPQLIDTDMIISENILLMQDFAMKKNIELSYEMNDLAKLYGDKDMLNTILRNLISNAIKFTPNGGFVRVDVSAVTEKGKTMGVISVKDSGLGIATKKKDKLFKIRYSVATEDTDNKKGTGLGLLLCKEFVSKHHGDIWVESEEGKGSTFYFTIPISSN